MGWGRKRKRAFAIRLFLTLAAAAMLAGGIIAFKMWMPGDGADQAAGQESTVETPGTDAGEIPDRQPGTEPGKNTETHTEDADETEETKSGITEGTDVETAADTGEETPAATGKNLGEETAAAAGDSMEEEPERKYAVTVENKDEFAGQVMASRAYLLDKYLTGFVEERKLKADKGRILDVAVASDNARCTEFYVELNNRKKTLVTLRWDPYTCTVNASKCQYTRKEIEDAVWGGENAAVTDISQEEDAAVIEAQAGAQTETDDTDGDGGGKEVILE